MPSSRRRASNSPGQQQRQQLSPQQKRLLSITNAFEGMNSVYQGISDLTRGIVQRVVHASDKQFTMHAIEQGVGDSLTDAITTNLFSTHVNQFQELADQDSATSETVMALNEIILRQQSHIAGVLSGNTPLGSLRREGRIGDPKLEQLYQMLVSRMHEGQAQLPFEKLKKRLKVRRMTSMKDADLIGSLYREFQITGETIIQMLEGKPYRRTLLQDPELNEIPMMQRLYIQNAGVDDERQKQSMETIIVHGALGPDDIKGFAIVTVAPRNPADDPHYHHEYTELLQQLKFSDDHGSKTGPERRFFEQYLLGENAPSAILEIFAGNERGVAELALEQAIQSPRITALLKEYPRAMIFAYVMERLHVWIDGKLLQGDLAQALGQHSRSFQTLLKNAFRSSKASKEHDRKNPVKTFPVPTMRSAAEIGAAPDWKYVVGPLAEVRDRLTSQHGSNVLTPPPAEQ